MLLAADLTPEDYGLDSDESSGDGNDSSDDDDAGAGQGEQGREKESPPAQQVPTRKVGRFLACVDVVVDASRVLTGIRVHGISWESCACTCT